MFGADNSNLNYSDNNVNKQQTMINDNQLSGLIPRVLDRMYYLESGQNGSFNFYCSFIQIYNEKIFDLLADYKKPKSLQIHENKIDGIYIEGLSEYSVTNYQDCLKLIQRGEKNRNIRQTVMNTKSSRSHTIFQIIIEASKADE